MNILLQGTIAADHEALFRSLMPPAWTVSVWDPVRHSEKEILPLLATANIVVGGNIPLPAWPVAPELQLIQIPWAGHNFTSAERMPAGIPVANCYEHESAIAEYVMLCILEWQIKLREMDARFRREGWGGRMPAGGIFHKEVRGQTLGIIGYGHIGEEVATRAKAFGMSVIATRRSQQPTPPVLDWLGTANQLPELLQRSDFILLACDLNERTHNLINRETLGQMKPDAVVINVSRGEVIDEEALYSSLLERQIGGAVLDVWYNYNQLGEDEVWPCNQPFQDLDNVILSAHECCWTKEQDQRRWQTVVDNVQRIEQGETARNIVFTGTATTGSNA